MAETNEERIKREQAEALRRMNEQAKKDKPSSFTEADEQAARQRAREARDRAQERELLVPTMPSDGSGSHIPSKGRDKVDIERELTDTDDKPLKVRKR